MEMNFDSLLDDLLDSNKKDEDKGYYENGIFYYRGLPDDLDNLKSCQAIKDIVNPPLNDYQSVDLLRCLFSERHNLFYSTGLGKTFMAAAFMKAIRNSNQSAKFLMIVKLNQEAQTPKKIYEISGLRTKFYSASARDIISPNDIDKYDIIMITHDSLSSKPHMDKLNLYLNEFAGVIVDEIHLLSNIEESIQAFMLYSISHRVKYFLGLTATPVTSDLEQFARILKISAPLVVQNFRKLGGDLKTRGIGCLPNEYYDLFTIHERDFSNREPKVAWVQPMQHQIGADGKDLFMITKGPGAYNQAKALIEIIKTHSGQKGLVYVNLSKVYEFILPYLVKHGIRAIAINGSTSKRDRDSILEDYRNGEYDVILTNIKEALDMESDYLVFYELSKHVKQIVGRAERGFGAKKLPIYYMLTEQTGERDYFYRNVYKISQDIQEMLEMDSSEVVNLDFSKSSSFKF